MRAMILSSSPRRDGNSAALARAAAEGLDEAGHDCDLVYADDILSAFLKDCRKCRLPDGTCSIAASAPPSSTPICRHTGFIAATPIYWYGTSAQLKAFFDRMFCYVAASYPGSSGVMESMKGKRIGLLLSSEETFPTVSSAAVHMFQEFSRYTRSSFVGLVHGIGNARGDVDHDPQSPLLSARRFGREFFTAHASDYQIDTPRSGRVWERRGRNVA
jgi:multimeric flavodoxin WrbA